METKILTIEQKCLVGKKLEMSLANPSETEGFTLMSGMYVEFLYKGLPSEAGPFFHSIFMDWLPNSNFELDNRPHFEVMGEKYKNDDPDSEELVYIPIVSR
ncbi:GyrI-like domain-containing protein [Leptospira ellinghausenii]|nr:GyrI-like domain-containing protein [Leptospira ellinghausenii]